MLKEQKTLIFNPENFTKLKSIVERLCELEEGKNENLNTKKKNLESTSNYILSNKKIRIPVLGAYNSGKSTFLNTLIGEKELLPVQSTICTRVGVIIEYQNEPDPKLFSIKVDKDPIDNYYYFKYNNESQPECVGKEEVKEFLKNKNKEKNSNGPSYYLLKTKIQYFDDENFDDNLKKKIQLLDIPGLGTDDSEENTQAKDIFEKIITSSDAFIFTTSDIIQNKSNSEILDEVDQNTQKFIGKFNLDISLFLMTKVDQNDNFNFEESKEKFLEYLSKLCLKREGDSSEEKKKNIAAFSSKKYNDYQEKKAKFTDIYKYIKHYYNEHKEDDNEDDDEDDDEEGDCGGSFLKLIVHDIDSYIDSFIFPKDILENIGNDSQEEIEAIKKEIIESIEKIKNEEERGSSNFDFTIDENILLEASKKFYLVRNKIKSSDIYIKTYADTFFSQFKNVLEKAEKEIEEKFCHLSKKSIAELGFTFEDIEKKISGEESKKKLEKEDQEKLEADVSACFSNCKEEISNIFKRERKSFSGEVKRVCDLEKGSEIQKEFHKFVESYNAEQEENTLESKIISVFNELKGKIEDKLEKTIEVKVPFKKFKIKEQCNYFSFRSNLFFKSSFLLLSFVPLGIEIFLLSVIGMSIFGLTNVIMDVAKRLTKFRKKLLSVQGEVLKLLGKVEKSIEGYIDTLEAQTIKEIKELIVQMNQEYNIIKNNKEKFLALYEEFKNVSGI